MGQRKAKQTCEEMSIWGSTYITACLHATSLSRSMRLLMAYNVAPSPCGSTSGTMWMLGVSRGCVDLNFCSFPD